MATTKTTEHTYTGNNSTTDYSVSFEYLKEADVKVTLDHVATTAYSFVNATTLRFTTAPGNGVAIRIYRDTDVDAARFVFSSGSALKAGELNENLDQLLYADQEKASTDAIADQAVTTAKLRDNAVTTAKLANTSITTAQLADSSVTTAKIAADAVNGTKIADDSINSEHYVDGSIDTAHIADAQVTLAKMAADSVDGSKIADNSINSEHYVDGSIDTAHIANAQVTTAKIADDAVTADKLANTAVTAGSYTAADITVDAQGRVTAASNGAIGTAEITDSAVTTAKIADANVTTAKIADSAVTTAKIADAELVELATMGGNTASALADLTQAEVQILDGATVTTAELNILDGVTATATELNQLDGNTLKTSSTDFTSSSQFPAASEIDARITARIDPLGGFEAIADEDSFPATAPPAGTVVSIANANGLAVNGSGVGAGTRAGGSDAVVINGFPSTFNSTSLDNGIGLLVIATSTAHTYDFHRVVAKNEDVRQLSSDINDFKARYRIGSSNPTTNNDAGDLFFNTGTSKMLVRNAANNAWQEVQAVGDFFINTISSSSGTGGGSATFNGSAYRFTLSNAPTYAQQLLVSINGVVQKPNSGTSQPSEGFAIDGGDIILAAAPATGADAFFITIGSSVGIGTPSDNTISTAKIIDDAVTSAKIATLDANLQFADSVEARFGAGNDLRIYHDGSHSRIVDAGTGNLIAQASRFSVHSADDSETMIDAVADSHVKLYHNGSEKLATKVDGIDVTGEVQCDTLDVSGKAGIGATNNTSYDASAQNLLVSDTSASSGITIRSGGGTPFGCIHFADGTSSNAEKRAGRIMYGHSGDFMLFSTADSEAFRIDSTGRMLIGTTTAGAFTNRRVSIATSSGTTALELRSATNGDSRIVFTDSTNSSDSGSYKGQILYDQTSDFMSFNTNGNNERMRIDSSGNVLVGKTASSGLNAGCEFRPSGMGLFTRASANPLQVRRLTDDGDLVEFYQDSSLIGSIGVSGSSLTVDMAGSEKLRIDSSGKVGIGFTPGSASLEVQGQNTYQNSASTLATAASKAAFRVKGSNNSSDSLWMGTVTTNAEPYIQGANGTGSTAKKFLLNPFGGNVGIGLTVPASKAHIKGGSLTVEHGSPTTGTGQLNINSEVNSQVSFSFDDQGCIAFGTAATPHNQGSFSEKVRIQNGGGISFNGDTAQVNALDDYEEGTWTPTLTGSSSAPSISYNTRLGEYVKIGSIVHLSFFIQVASVSAQGGGQLRITGLPFSAKNSTGAGEVPGLLLQSEPYTAGDGANRVQMVRTAPNQAQFYVLHKDLTTGQTHIDNTGAAQIGTGYMIGSITYRTN